MFPAVRGERSAPTLTEGDLHEVQTLTTLCNAYEGLDIPTSLEPPPLLHRQDGVLIGFASLQGGGEIEACIIVHPEHRRKGVGRALLAATMAECRKQGWHRLLLVCDEASWSGRQFITAVGAQHRNSEHRMRLAAGDAGHLASPPTALQVTQAGPEEAEAVAHLISMAFGNPIEEEERRRLARDMGKSTHRFFIGLRAGEPVGSLGVVGQGHRAYIIGFGVLPQSRGRGYGHEMLVWTTDMLRAEHWGEIMIEVDTSNHSAVRLYRSCGFDVTTTYGFYAVTM
ncbi:MAG: GNAT family N-acetyltransferase [Armatimonadota bacterium]